jgi:hypothetical protein
MYVCAVRNDKRKWVGIATWTGGPQTCLALAEDVFRHYGIQGETFWKDSMERQKNFAGYSSVVHLTDTEEDARIYACLRRIGDYVAMKGVEEGLRYYEEMYCCGGLHAEALRMYREGMR